MSHKVDNFAFASAEMVGAAAIRCLHDAMAALTAGLLAMADPPLGAVLLADADDVAELAVDAAVVEELEAGAADELDEELLPHPPMTAATASRAESFLIMPDTLTVEVGSFSVV